MAIKKSQKQGSDNSEGQKIKNKFKVENNYLIKIGSTGQTEVANFWAEIIGQWLRADENGVRQRVFKIAVHTFGSQIHFSISSDDFYKSKLIHKIVQVAGPNIILYGSLQELRTSILEFTQKNPPIMQMTEDAGFTVGNYLSPNLLITPNGMTRNPAIQLDLSGGNFSPNLGFSYKIRRSIKSLAKHILNDFLDLKDHRVTFPLMGHICLAPFSSLIAEISGKKKPTLHLQGSSGGGKTFLGSLAQCFFGSFGDRIFSWTSTPNSIEIEGFFFKDALFLIDDYKRANVDQKTVVRILQGVADGHGRSRGTANSKIQRSLYVRGLILSTGEDFLADIESITGRTILIPVEPDKNLKAGRRCRQKNCDYNSFLPGLIHTVISKPDWKQIAQKFIDQKVKEFDSKTNSVSNGLRIASNWALNSWGFNNFLNYLQVLDIIDNEESFKLKNEYHQVARFHINEHVDRISRENPVEIFFRVIGQRLHTGTAALLGTQCVKGKTFGFIKKKKPFVYLYPDIVIELLVSHFRATGEKIPFNRTNLRTELAEQKLIKRANPKRWTKQVRQRSGQRVQAWEFDSEQFWQRCGIDPNKIQKK